MEHFDEKSWQQLWTEYQQEVRRWDDKKQIAVCGKKFNTTNISLDADLKDSTKKVIGEFLRLYHPRLAHEIALFGFPGVDGNFIKFGNEVENEIYDLAGLIARSHGLNLRDTFDYIENRFYNLREPHSVKAIFLMVLLRVADYLQFTAERAPKSSFDIRKISSPYSRLQWSIHNSIKNITHNNHDPELLQVIAFPETTFEYLELNKLFKGIQLELDHSWAVIGEVYGENTELSKLKIRLRRIRSNIEEKRFKQDLQYLPKKIAFESDSEITKLLVQPLYGDDPTFGIRELLQNSLDACRERAEIQKTGNPNYIPEIKITINKFEEEIYEFIIQDNGIGMTEDILLNYFLKAGSTFRKSLEWKREFANKGTSNIQRSGKFGVGVLAAFLLGEEIYVETKRIGTDRGYYFSARLDDEILEIRKKEREPGTLIRILMREKEIMKLKAQLRHYNKNPKWFEWYKFDYPKVSLDLPKDWSISKINKFEIDRETSQIKGWRRFSNPYFTAIDWSYTDTKKVVLCNGIVIPQEIKMDRYYFPSFPVVPSLSIIDFNGNLPLSLNRNEVNGELPFLNDLATDICKDILWELLHLPSFENVDELDLDRLRKLEHPALGERSTWGYDFKWGEKDILFTKNGYILSHPYCIEKSNIKRIVALWAKENTKDVIPSIPLEQDFVGYSLQDELANNSEFKDRLYDLNLRFGNRLLSASQKQMYIHKDDYNHFFLKNRRLTQVFKDSIDIETINEEWICLINKDKFQSNIHDYHLNASIKLAIEYNITEPFIINPYQTDESLDIMKQLLQYYLGENVVIPYSMKERKECFPKVFEELAPSRLNK